jgi:hypothetical protein
MFNINDPVTKLVATVVTIGIGILLITIFPIGLFAFAALGGVLYYLFKNKKNT